MSKLILLGVSLAVVWWWYFVGLYIVKTAKQHKKQRSQREDDKRKRMLTMTAIGEHENGLLPHIDPNVIEVCTVPSCNGAGVETKVARARKIMEEKILQNEGGWVKPGMLYPEVGSLKAQYQDVPAEPILRIEPLPVSLRPREELMDRALHAFNLYKSMPTPEDAQELGYPPETLSSKLRKLDKQELSPDERDAEERRILATWRHQK